MYDENIFKIVDNHKNHLRVILSPNIDSKINSASVQISYLRKLKFQLPKRPLNKLYWTFICPLLKYASEICNCNLSDTDRLEQALLNAAFVVNVLHLDQYI